MTNLKNFLDNASEQYYAGKPFITDAQFDRLAESSDYGAVGAPAAGKAVKHYYQMYSLQKFYEDEGKARPLGGVSDVSASIKLDGAAISLLYVGGQLVRALTRGDGVEGQDISDKLIGSTDRKSVV